MNGAGSNEVLWVVRWSSSPLQEMNQKIRKEKVPRNLFYLLWQYTAVLDLVHTTLGKLENAALFLPLGLPSTLIRHENGTFRKRSSNRKVLKTAALRFSVNGKHFEKRAFDKR